MQLSNSAIGKFLIAIVLAASCVQAANEDEAAVLAAALKAEAELVNSIEKAVEAFVFISDRSFTGWRAHTIGSGVVISQDGYILTNHHVVGRLRRCQVRIGMNTLKTCDLVGTDPVADLALLKARDVKDLKFIELGEMSKARVGQQILSVGDPYDLADYDKPSFSIGTLSTLHLAVERKSPLIQTDAAINMGNSGGPVLTLDGKLLGLATTLKPRFGAGNTGIGHAVPVDQIARMLPALKQANGNVVYHGRLPNGLNLTETTDGQTVHASVVPGSPAHAAGFRAGDRIVSIAGGSAVSTMHAESLARSHPENAIVDVVVERSGRSQTLKVMLPRYDLPEEAATIEVDAPVQPLEQ